MCEEIGMRSMSSTVNVARDWLGGMGQGAENQNFSIQCEQTTPRISVISLSSVWRSEGGLAFGGADCMTVPLITMNSANIKPAT